MMIHNRNKARPKLPEAAPFEDSSVVTFSDDVNACWIMAQ